MRHSQFNPKYKKHFLYDRYPQYRLSGIGGTYFQLSEAYAQKHFYISVRISRSQIIQYSSLPVTTNYKMSCEPNICLYLNREAVVFCYRILILLFLTKQCLRCNVTALCKLCYGDDQNEEKDKSHDRIAACRSDAGCMWQ